ncbi:MAG: hypothetical protein R3B13_15590 [Polyangiaceae bacterium]
MPFLRWFLSFALLVLPRAAAADSFGGQLHYMVGQAALDGVELEMPALISEPSALADKHLTLRGQGTLEGVSARGDFLFEDNWRIGLGSSLFGVDGVGLRHDSLPWGMSARLHSVWGTTTQLSLGYEIKQGPVYAYVDGRVSFEVLQVSVETFAAPYGHVGTTNYTAFQGGLGPRFGALLPIGHSLMLDVYVYRQLVSGFEQLSVGIGLGYWENDREDDFSDELRRSWRGDF